MAKSQQRDHREQYEDIRDRFYNEEDGALTPTLSREDADKLFGFFDDYYGEKEREITRQQVLIGAYRSVLTDIRERFPVVAAYIDQMRALADKYSAIDGDKP